MRVVNPVEIGSSQFISSSVPEPDASQGEILWDPLGDWELDDIVIRVETHGKYRNVLAGVNADLPELTPTRWQYIGATNRFAVFDIIRSTATTAVSPYVVTIKPGVRVDSIAVLGMVGDELNIQMSAGGIVYDNTTDINTREVTNWFEYFYSLFSYINNVIRFELPQISDAEITVTITSSTGEVSCGAVVVGNMTYIGSTQEESSSDELNFSKIERNLDGTSVLLPRPTVPKVDTIVVSKKSDIAKIREVRKLLNARAAVWSGLDDATDDYYDTFLLLGVYKKFRFVFNSPDNFDIELEIEEV